MHNQKTVHDSGAGISDNVTIIKYDLDSVKSEFPEIESMPKAEQFEILEEHADSEIQKTSNVTTTGLHEYVADLLNHFNSLETIQDPATKVEFGTAVDAQYTKSSDGLEGYVGEINLTSPESDGTIWRCNERLGSLELNDLTLTELSIVAESGRHWNFAHIDPPIEKDSSTAITVQVQLPIDDNGTT